MKISSLLAAGFPRLSTKLSLFLAVSLLLIPAGRATAQTLTTLHTFFNCTICDGDYPYAGLILSGNTLYGTTSSGGTSGNGTVFAINTDGTGFTILHSFTGTSDGASPYAGLILSGNTLYGTAHDGGTSGNGTVFAVNTDGTGFTILYDFTGTTDGGNPYAGLILSGNTLYGTTVYHGTSNGGTVFAINTDGTGFTILHSFTGTSDGANLYAGLILSGNTLYGTAAYGGTSNAGTVFAVNTDGTGFTILYNFTGTTDGASPLAGLILSGNILYGTTYYGGTSGVGTVFAINTDGTGFTTLHNFTGTTDGASPLAGLILSGNTLYGTAAYGGTSNAGTVFAINTDGTGFTTLHSFTSDGISPVARLSLSGNALYGTTYGYGTHELGTVFAVNTDGTGFTTLHSFAHVGGGAFPVAGLILSGNTLYGTAAYGGPSAGGTVFAVNTDGTGFTVLHSFTYSDGANPVAGLILSGNTLYGTTFGAGPSGGGTVFAVNTDGTGFTILHSFTGTTDGANPYAGLILSGNTLYGTTYYGGTSNGGTVFAINTDGTGFTTLHSFTYSDGGNPYAGLILSGNTLYGTTSSGGTSNGGTVFAVNTDGTGFTTLHSFTFGSDGANPRAGLILSGNTLYGTTYDGDGTSANGTVFAVNTDGTGFTTLHSFTYSDGGNPYAGLILSGNTLYGTTVYHGTSNGGTVFAINTDGTGFTVLHSFTFDSNGAGPHAGLILSGNTLYGATFSYDNSSNAGTVFSLSLAGAQSAFSRKVHGGAGTFDIPLPLTGNVGVECRTGPKYQMIVNFASAVTVDSVTVTSGTGNVDSFSGNGTPTITVNLTGVTNAQRITVTLHNVHDGIRTSDVPVSMGVLTGDVSGNGSVNATDVIVTKLQAGQVVSATNFREDVNASGAIGAADVALVKSLAGTSLPP